MKLKPCPCGKVPEKLNTAQWSNSPMHIIGSCCEKWRFEVEPKEEDDLHRLWVEGRTRTYVRKLAIIWNEAPRGEQHE